MRIVFVGKFSFIEAVSLTLDHPDCAVHFVDTVEEYQAIVNAGANPSTIVRTQAQPWPPRSTQLRYYAAGIAGFQNIVRNPGRMYGKSVVAALGESAAKLAGMRAHMVIEDDLVKMDFAEMEKRITALPRDEVIVLDSMSAYDNYCAETGMITEIKCMTESQPKPKGLRRERGSKGDRHRNKRYRWS